MDRSQYLVQALQQMDQQPAASSQAPDLAAMQKAAQARDAWQAANPGQSYIGHNIEQFGQNVADAPGNLMAMPGNAASGFQRMMQGLPGQSQQGQILVSPNAAPWAMGGLPPGS